MRREGSYVSHRTSSSRALFILSASGSSLTAGDLSCTHAPGIGTRGAPIASLPRLNGSCQRAKLSWRYVGLPVLGPTRE